MPLAIGQLIEEKYRILRLIGEGGMGAVYEGENIRISRRVAIKVLHSDFAHKPEIVERFEREAQAAGRIGNDHILEVLDLGKLEGGEHFIVMEYLDGEPLSARLEREVHLTAGQASVIILQVLYGLAAAHNAGIIHRDLKPENVFIVKPRLGKSEFVKIIDFGISKFVQPPTEAELKMTHSGTVMGTPYYMSPEQAAGSGDVDARSDLYSIGVILYEAVTGQVPFDATSYNQLMFKIAQAEPEALPQLVPGLDLEFVSIVQRAMLKTPDARFQSAHEFATVLSSWLERSRAATIPPASFLPPLPSSASASPAVPPVAVPDTSELITTRSWEQSQPNFRPNRSRLPLFIGLGVGLLSAAIGLVSWLSPASNNKPSALREGYSGSGAPEPSAALPQNSAGQPDVLPLTPLESERKPTLDMPIQTSVEPSEARPRKVAPRPVFGRHGRNDGAAGGGNRGKTPVDFGY